MMGLWEYGSFKQLKRYESTLPGVSYLVIWSGHAGIRPFSKICPMARGTLVQLLLDPFSGTLLGNRPLPVALSNALEAVWSNWCGVAWHSQRQLHPEFDHTVILAPRSIFQPRIPIVSEFDHTLLLAPGQCSNLWFQLFQLVVLLLEFIFLV